MSEKVKEQKFASNIIGSLFTSTDNSMLHQKVCVINLLNHWASESILRHNLILDNICIVFIVVISAKDNIEII